MGRPSGRRLNGEGSITLRADGRWLGRFYAWTSAGARKRVTIYGTTRKQAADRMREAQERNSQGIHVPDRSWKLGDWLNYWLEHVVAPNRRPATYRLYEMTVRLYLKPALGTSPLARLSAAPIQAFLNGQLAAGRSIRQVQIIKTVLSSALSRAMREELVSGTWPGWPSCPHGSARPSNPGHRPMRVSSLPSREMMRSTRDRQGHRDALGKISEALGGSHRTGP